MKRIFGCSKWAQVRENVQARIHSSPSMPCVTPVSHACGPPPNPPGYRNRGLGCLSPQPRGLPCSPDELSAAKPQELPGSPWDLRCSPPNLKLERLLLPLPASAFFSEMYRQSSWKYCFALFLKKRRRNSENLVSRNSLLFFDSYVALGKATSQDCRLHGDLCHSLGHLIIITASDDLTNPSGGVRSVRHPLADGPEMRRESLGAEQP